MSEANEPGPEPQLKKIISCPWCRTRVREEQGSCPNCQAVLFADKTSAEERVESAKKMTYGEQLLRAREHLFEDLFNEDNINKQISYFSLYALMFSFIYGLTVGMFSGGFQIMASGIKVPLILFGTLIICLPALYTFNVLLGSRLSLKQTLSTLLIVTYLISLILVSFAPILFFFTLSTDSRNFFSILNMVFCLVSGGFGISLLWRGMKFLTLRSGSEPDLTIIRIWSLIYMFVGTQFAWILRPFIGESGEFLLFRKLKGNFYLYLIELIKNLFQNPA